MLGGELEVRRLGFGAMRVVKDRAEGVRVVRRAVELGVTLIDTADIYGAGTSEEVVAEALHPYPEGVVVATKGGLGYGLQDRIRDGRPEHLREACEASLRRLKLERIDLYQLHRHDPEVPIEESIGALVQLRDEGKIRLIGVSNFSLSQLRRRRRWRRSHPCRTSSTAACSRRRTCSTPAQKRASRSCRGRRSARVSRAAPPTRSAGSSTARP